jgi:hypothetical protein
MNSPDDVNKDDIAYCLYSDFHPQSRDGIPAEYAKKLAYVGRVKYIYSFTLKGPPRMTTSLSAAHCTQFP